MPVIEIPDKYWILRLHKKDLVAKPFCHFWDDKDSFWPETNIQGEVKVLSNGQQYPIIKNIEEYIEYWYNNKQKLDSEDGPYKWELLTNGRMMQNKLDECYMYMTNKEVQDSNYILWIRKQASEDIERDKKIYAYFWCDGPDQTSPQSENFPKAYRYTFTLDIKASIGISLHNKMKEINEDVNIQEMLRPRGVKFPSPSGPQDDSYSFIFFDPFESMPWLRHKFANLSIESCVTESKFIENSQMVDLIRINLIGYQIAEIQNMKYDDLMFGVIDCSSAPWVSSDPNTKFSTATLNWPDQLIYWDEQNHGGPVDLLQSAIYTSPQKIFNSTNTDTSPFDSTYDPDNSQFTTKKEFNWNGYFKYLIVPFSAIIESPFSSSVVSTQPHDNDFYLNNKATDTNAKIYDVVLRLITNQYVLNTKIGNMAGLIDNAYFLIPISYQSDEYYPISRQTAALFSPLLISGSGDDKSLYHGKATITDTSKIGSCVCEIPPILLSCALANNQYTVSAWNSADLRSIRNLDPSSIWYNWKDRSSWISESYQNQYAGCYLFNGVALNDNNAIPNLIANTWGILSQSDGINITLSRSVVLDNVLQDLIDPYELISEIKDWSDNFTNAWQHDDTIPKNIMSNEPYFLMDDMQFLSFFTDEQNKLILTASMLDQEKLFDYSKINNGILWEIYLRLTADRTFNYEIDIDQVVNDNYKFSNDKRELMLQDNRQFSWQSDAYADYSRKAPLQEQIRENSLAYQQQFQREQFFRNSLQNTMQAGGTSAALGGGAWGAVMVGQSVLSTLFGAINLSAQQNFQRQQLRREIQSQQLNAVMTSATQHSGAFFGNLLADKKSTIFQYRSIVKLYKQHPDIQKWIWSIIHSRGFSWNEFTKYKKYLCRRDFNFVRFDLHAKSEWVYKVLLTCDDIYHPYKMYDFAEWFIHILSADNWFKIVPDCDIFDDPDNIEFELEYKYTKFDLSEVVGRVYYEQNIDNVKTQILDYIVKSYKIDLRQIKYALSWTWEETDIDNNKRFKIKATPTTPGYDENRWLENETGIFIIQKLYIFDLALLKTSAYPQIVVFDDGYWNNLSFSQRCDLINTYVMQEYKKWDPKYPDDYKIPSEFGDNQLDHVFSKYDWSFNPITFKPLINENFSGHQHLPTSLDAVLVDNISLKYLNSFVLPQYVTIFDINLNDEFNFKNDSDLKWFSDDSDSNTPSFYGTIHCAYNISEMRVTQDLLPIYENKNSWNLTYRDETGFLDSKEEWKYSTWDSGQYNTHYVRSGNRRDGDISMSLVSIKDQIFCAGSLGVSDAYVDITTSGFLCSFSSTLYNEWTEDDPCIITITLFINVNLVGWNPGDATLDAFIEFSKDTNDNFFHKLEENGINISYSFNSTPIDYDRLTFPNEAFNINSVCTMIITAKIWWKDQTIQHDFRQFTSVFSTRLFTNTQTSGTGGLVGGNHTDWLINCGHVKFEYNPNQPSKK